jgi:hypothetical protein
VCKEEKYEENKEKTDLLTRFAKRPLPAAAGRPCPAVRRDPGCSWSACTSTCLRALSQEGSVRGACYIFKKKQTHSMDSPEAETELLRDSYWRWFAAAAAAASRPVSGPSPLVRRLPPGTPPDRRPDRAAALVRHVLTRCRVDCAPDRSLHCCWPVCRPRSDRQDSAGRYPCWSDTAGWASGSDRCWAGREDCCAWGRGCPAGCRSWVRPPDRGCCWRWREDRDRWEDSHEPDMEDSPRDSWRNCCSTSGSASAINKMEVFKASVVII